MLRSLALFVIRLYQRHLSPKKGFGCAYRLVYGGCGCSGVGYRLIRRYGVFSGCRLLRLRLAHCRFAYTHYCAPAPSPAPTAKRANGIAYYQRGDWRARCVPLRYARCVRLRRCESAHQPRIGRLRGCLPLRHEIARVRHIGRLCQRLPLRCLRCDGLRAQGRRARAEEETDSDAEFEINGFSGCLFVAMNRQPET